MTEMGAGGTWHQPPSAGQAIVAFDFDGTLTVRDSFTTFLRRRAGRRRWALGLVRLAPATAAYARDRDRGAIKAAAVKEFLKGITRAELEADAEAYADKAWRKLMRPDALETWNDWGQRGAHRVIVTASPALTVAPFARRLGAEGLLGTDLTFDLEDRLTGALESANCRGEEKVRRLYRAYGSDLRLTAAYGDTSGDAEMLQIAEIAGFRVFRERP